MKKIIIISLLLLFVTSVVCASQNWKVLQPFGKYTDETGSERLNNGINILMPIGTPIPAPMPGTIIAIETDPNGYGYYIVVDHGNGKQTIYGHILPSVLQMHQVGDHLNKNDTVALSGNEGNSTVPHLHLGYTESGDPYGKGCIDPLPMLRAAGWDLDTEAVIIKIIER